MTPGVQAPHRDGADRCAGSHCCCRAGSPVNPCRQKGCHGGQMCVACLNGSCGHPWRARADLDAAPDAPSRAAPPGAPGTRGRCCVCREPIPLRDGGRGAQRYLYCSTACARVARSDAAARKAAARKAARGASPSPSPSPGVPCAVCGRPIPPQEGRGRQRIVCDARCRRRRIAAQKAERRAAVLRSSP